MSDGSCQRNDPMHELKQFLDNINLSELFTSAERWQDIFRTDFVDRSTLRERCSFGMTYPEARDRIQIKSIDLQKERNSSVGEQG